MVQTAMETWVGDFARLGVRHVAMTVHAGQVVHPHVRGVREAHAGALGGQAAELMTLDAAGVAGDRALGGLALHVEVVGPDVEPLVAAPFDLVGEARRRVTRRCRSRHASHGPWSSALRPPGAWLCRRSSTCSWTWPTPARPGWPRPRQGMPAPRGRRTKMFDTTHAVSDGIGDRRSSTHRPHMAPLATTSRALVPQDRQSPVSARILAPRKQWSDPDQQSDFEPETCRRRAWRRTPKRRAESPYDDAFRSSSRPRRPSSAAREAPSRRSRRRGPAGTSPAARPARAGASAAPLCPPGVRAPARRRRAGRSEPPGTVTRQEVACARAAAEGEGAAPKGRSSPR